MTAPYEPVRLDSRLLAVHALPSAHPTGSMQGGRNRPLTVCVDETSKQLTAETRRPIAAKPGRPKRIDYEYQRNETVNLFMMFAPLEGWRHVEVTDRRTALDYAQVLKHLSDTHFPTATKIVLVQDNLSTHTPASLYEAFPAGALVARLLPCPAVGQR
jgi:hypothetical protein